MIIKRYDVSIGPAMLLVVMSPPKRRSKSKLKDYNKSFQKSIQHGRVFSSNDFSTIQQHLSSEFPNIITPRNKILEELKTILAGLMLGFVPIQNVKYTLDIPKKNFTVFDAIHARQYVFMVNIVGMNEDGLYLAHENQIAYIKQEIDSGKNPNSIRNIPSLQKGSDAQNKVTAQKPEDHKAIKKFRKRLQQKKDDVQIQEELDYETVIDFASHQNSDQPSNLSSSAGLPLTPPSSQISSLNHSRPAPLPHPAAVPVSAPQIIPDSFSGLHQKIITPSQEGRDVDGEINQLQTQLSLITDTLTQQLAEKDTDIINYQKEIKKIQENWGQSKLSSKKLTQDNLAMQAEIQKKENKITLLKVKTHNLERTIEKIEQQNRDLTVQLHDAAQEADQRYHQTMDEKLNLEIIATELQEELADLRRDLEKKAGTQG